MSTRSGTAAYRPTVVTVSISGSRLGRTLPASVCHDTSPAPIAQRRLRGVWACMKHELRQMREQGSGAIVNCSSLGGLVGLPGRASYHASKHGVLGLTKSAALEYAPREIGRA